eukprot:4894101-Amphidinium_carterae.1
MPDVISKHCQPEVSDTLKNSLIQPKLKELILREREKRFPQDYAHRQVGRTRTPVTLPTGRA